MAKKNTTAELENDCHCHKVPTVRLLARWSRQVVLREKSCEFSQIPRQRNTIPSSICLENEWSGVNYQKVDTSYMRSRSLIRECS